MPDVTVDHWWRRPGDLAAVAALIVLPALIFGVPALIGHPVLPGDDMTQNYPLRVLAGRDIADGRLPLFDPYIWSGSALLAGWNAGAAYPLTLLFAVLPGVAAWSAGLVITFAVAGVGMFGFLRALRLGSAAGFAGALSFGLAGAMSAQVTHFGLVAGMSWVPLALLAVLRLTPGPDSPGSAGPGPRAGWTALLGVSTGLLILAGEPRAIVDGYVIVTLYAIWRLARTGRSGPRGQNGHSAFRVLFRSCLRVASGLVLGLALGAVQWLPGLAAIATSQRGNGSLALFSSGSLPDRWLLLTLVPDLLGGSGSLSQPSFFASYNLTEVTSYVGILPLVAAFALLARVRPRARPPEWLIWHLMAVIGVVLSLGGNTPLGAVLYRLPLYGGQRLQSRNVVLLDLALAVLLAYWVDQPFPARTPARGTAGAGTAPEARRPAEARQPVAAGTGSRRGSFGGKAFLVFRGRGVHAETLLGLLPPFGMLAVVLLGLTWGAGFLRWLGSSAGPGLAARLQPWLLPYAVIAVAAGALVVFGRRLRPQAWRRACVAFAVTDIVVFTVLAVVRVAPAGSGEVSAPGASGTSRVPDATVTSSAPRPVSALGFTGRFAIYDPGLLDTAGLSALGPPDLNDLAPDGMGSVQGYTSIVNGTYATATGAHTATGNGQNTLSPAAVGNGTLDQLDTSILLTLPAYLTTTAKAGGAAASGGDPAGQALAGQRDIAAGKLATWYLGESAAVSEVRVPDAHARADAAAGTEIGLTEPDGTTRWFRARAAGAGTLEVSLPAPVMTTTVIGRAGRAPDVLGPPSVVLHGGQVLVADGQLQGSLVPPRWELAGSDGAFAVFRDRFASGPLTVRALPGRPAAGASVRYVMGAGGDPVRAEVSSADGVRLVRSVAAIPGWTATWRPVRGTTVALSVYADGLVQAVDVPAGKGTVTWHYAAPKFRTGLALTLGAMLLIALLTLLALADGRSWRTSWLPRHRRNRGRNGPLVPGSGPGDRTGEWPPRPSHEGEEEDVQVLRLPPR